MTRLSLNEDFTSLTGFDLTRSGAAGFRWYLTAPWWLPSTAARDLRIASDATSQNFLRLTSSATNCNWSIATMDPRSGNGATYKYGYFEARLRFAPVVEPDWDSNPPIDWPSFWALSVPTVRGSADPHATELDFFEAINGPKGFGGTMHDNRTKVDHFTNSNAGQTPGHDTSAWHTYGCLWERERVTWYLDGKALMSQTWGSRGVHPAPRDVNPERSAGVPRDVFASFDVNPLVVALGTGRTHPMDIDHVRIWQA